MVQNIEDETQDPRVHRDNNLTDNEDVRLNKEIRIYICNIYPIPHGIFLSSALKQFSYYAGFYLTHLKNLNISKRLPQKNKFDYGIKSEPVMIYNS